MTRDLELVRQLLSFFDAKDSYGPVEVPPIAGFDEMTIKYHCLLLYQAGWLDCEPIKSTTSDRIIKVIPFNLTWAGHEFLTDANKQPIWDEVMADIKRSGFKDTSMKLLRQMLDKAIRKKMGMDGNA